MNAKILMIILDIFGIGLAITGLWLSHKMKQKRVSEKAEMKKQHHSPKPGSTAHYEAWREEQLKKKAGEGD